jgi:uncharacterized surface protein with fasciclin (FAS1) repeats
MHNGTSTHKNLLQTAREVGSVTTLLAAFEQAGLTRTLIDNGPVTVFAPDDEAFAALPEGAVDSLLAEPEMLSSVIGYHVVPGRLALAQVAYLRRAQTLQGESLRLSLDGYLHIDGARLVEADIEASNGVIHVIDRVLLPAQI